MLDLASLPQRHYRAILADPPWRFEHWGEQPEDTRDVAKHYPVLALSDIKAFPVGNLAAPDCTLFLWATSPCLAHALDVIAAWGFVYKTIGFSWIKAHAGQLEMFQDDLEDQMGLGYWSRQNVELCLLATRGHPQRLNMDVRQAIIEPRRQHSRKPDCVHGRIERLVAGPRLELFARRRVPGWDAWGNEIEKFREAAE